MSGERDHGTIKLDTSGHARMKPADFRWVSWTQGFWADRFAIARDVTLPWLRELAEEQDPSRHVVDNFKMAAGDLKEGQPALCNWSDAWMYKWLEAASAILGVTSDKTLETRMDEIIELISRAQESDGYLSTQIQLDDARERYTRPNHHEIYNMGHMLSAACINYRVTGKSRFLEVARKVGDHLWEMFKGNNRRMAHFPYNPSVIMGAVELYRTTGQKRYLDLANTIIDMRGMFPKGEVAEGGPVDPGLGDDNQDRVPLREDTQVVGHNVFWTYLYAGAADAYLETGDEDLKRALERLFVDFTETKMYITGGASSLHRAFSWRNGRAVDPVHEAAGEPYELPNAFAYNETCGQYGAFLWGWRMLHITGEARYADLMEREMYNGWLPAIDVEGRHFFYSNPLRWHGPDQRMHGPDSHGRHLPGRPLGLDKTVQGGHRICCPTNVLRGMAEMHGHFYSRTDGELWIHHYGGSVYDDGSLRLTQTTEYPWNGSVTFTIDTAPTGATTLKLRIPGWCTEAKVLINGDDTRSCPSATYVSLERSWVSGDRIELTLEMPPVLMTAHHKLEQARGQVAVMRGPLVYCLESPDLAEGVRVSDIQIPKQIRLRPEFQPDHLGGVTTLAGQALRVPTNDGGLYRPLGKDQSKTIDITLIPYYAWANRGDYEMSVWLPLA